MLSTEVFIDRREVKNARLRVSEDGTVDFIVPSRFTEAQVDGILARKAGWIAEKRRIFARRASTNRRLGPRQIPLFGRVFTFVLTPALRHLTVVDHRAKTVRTGFDLSEGEIRRRWNRRYAKAYLAGRAVELARSNGFTLRRLYVRAPWRRWGSCSSKCNISLNWRLIEAPSGVIDYVILHELLHTRLAAHDQRFWAQLRAICPDAERSREWLIAHPPP